MSLSRVAPKRWVIDGIDEQAVRYAKAIAAEHGVRIADIVAAAINDLWVFYNDGDDTFPHFDEVQTKR